ncbi:MAG: DNA polymerase III subunit gamma/tau [Chlorobiaceae bacterium]
MSYQVIARKYRPTKFADITAQEHITKTIQNSLRMGRLGHGYIFSGLRGVGKTTAARVFAKAVNCQKMAEDPDYLQQVTEPCGECESCRDFDSGTSLNIAEFDAASNNSVDDIRTLRENVRYGPQKGKYRVYIIDEVHMLSIAAFNAFLKTLEEPPPHAIFIFATTELHKIPATIASRCQRFNFKRIPLDQLQKQLHSICDAEHIPVDLDALQLIGRKAQGSMRDAQSILDQVIAFSVENDHEGRISYQKVAELLNYIDDEHMFGVTDAVAEQDASQMLDVAQFVLQNGYDEQDFLEKLIEHLRNILVVKNLSSTRLVERPEAVCERYLRDAANFTPDALMRMVDFLLLTQKELKFQFEYQFRFELALLKLIDIGTQAPAFSATLAAAEAASKKKAPDQPLIAAISKPTALDQPTGPTPLERVGAPLPAVPKTAPPKSPPPRSGRPASAAEGSIALGSWQKKLSGFAVNSTAKEFHVGAAPLQQEESGEAHREFSANIEVLKLEWRQFLEHISKKSHNFMATHLQSCELVACSSSGVLEIACCRKFSYEELQQDRAVLQKEVSEFYALPLQLRIRYDAEKDACTREKTVFTLFQELTQKNEVIRYLITEFGGELVY